MILDPSGTPITLGVILDLHIVPNLIVLKVTAVAFIDMLAFEINRAGKSKCTQGNRASHIQVLSNSS